MPSRSDSSRSLTSRPSRSLTRLRRRRTWLQVLLVLGFLQVILGVLVVTFSLVAATITASSKIRHSCPSWAGFSLALSGLIGIVSWKRPFSLLITFFTLLSVLGVMLSLAGSILSCQHAQLVRSLEVCEREKNSCICCQSRPEPPPPSCIPQGETLTMYPNPDCRSVRLALKDLLFSVCGLTVLSTVVCALSVGVCCVRIFSLDVTHVLVPQRSDSITLGCASPPEPFVHSGLDLEEFVPPGAPTPLLPPRVHLQLRDRRAELTEGSHGCMCDRVPSIVLSGEASTDSGSLLTSELPADSSSPSEDSCLLEPPGSARSVDYVLFRSIQRSRADYCLSVDCVRCSHHGRGPRGPFEDPPPNRARGERSFSCSTAEPRGDGALPGGAVTHSCNRLEGLARGGGGPCLPEVRLRGGRAGGGGTGAGRPFQPRRNSEASCPPSPAPALGPRPLLAIATVIPELRCSEITISGMFFIPKQWRTPCPLPLRIQRRTPSSALCTARPATPPALLRAASVGKSKALPPPKKTPARSLGDLKVCRGLVARFLHRPKHGVHGHKQAPGGAQEGIHLRSCGDLSSTSSLRRLLSARRRPRSLSGSCKESAL
uniref:Endosomal transmembrane epsin interactor 3 n=1 Tax=Gallus gallus TaxID=9031 RepID=A0A8V1AGM5_CHICK